MTRKIGLDTSLANKVFQIYLGRAYGQVFLATDTLIQAITVWRAAQPESIIALLRLLITEVDSTGKPDVLRILENGPVQQCPSTDGVHPGPCRFVFDPPFALPRQGRFFFTIQDALCYGGFYFLGDTLNRYPFGQAWFNTVNFDCSLGHARSYGAEDDLIFTIEFCDTSTPVLPTTWGQLKLKYR